MKVGLVGLGRWGRTLAEALKERVPGLSLTHVANRNDSEVLRQLKDRWPDLEVGHGLEPMIESEEVEAVIVATPNRTHAELAVRVLEAETHVFVEKPLAMDRDRVDQTYDRARAVGRTVFTGYIYLFEPTYERLRKSIAGDEVVEVRTTWLKHGSFGNSITWNLLSHEAAIAQSLLGTGLRLQNCDFDGMRDGFPNRTRVRARTDDGRVVTFRIDRLAGQDDRTKRVEVKSSGGESFRWEDGDLSVRQGSDSSLSQKRSSSEEQEPLVRELMAFQSRAVQGAPFPSRSFSHSLTEFLEDVAAGEDRWRHRG